MPFIVSEGRLRTLDRLRPRPSYRLRVSSDYTQDYAEIWRTQPSVRTVCSFLGRNIASLGIHTFERVSDTDRRRITDHPLARLIARPTPWTTRYRLIDALVQDSAIFDAAYWLKMKVDDADVAGLVRLEPPRITPIGGAGFVPDEFRYRGDRAVIDFPRDQVVHFRGYNPTDSVNGASPIESLRRVLAEEWEAGRMREQTLRNGARLSGYIHRPAATKPWSDEGFTRFKRDWKSQYTADGPEAGGTPILEDGMKFEPAAQTSEQLQYVQARKLTREEVAAAYHVPPPMVGIMDSATFSNITEQHKMLYQDTLGPWLTMIAEEIGLQLAPDFDGPSVYVEFNMGEKLRGSFEEQAQQLQSSVGAPWLTRNEARGRNNLPALPGGDDLVVPLNVLTGAQASPRDSGTQNLRARPTAPFKAPGPQITGDGEGVRVKSGTRVQDERAAEQVLVRFFRRQRGTVLSALGSKAGPAWWDEERWNSELADDLFALSLQVTTEVAQGALAELGIDPANYTPARTRAFLQAVADSRATAINSTTRDQIRQALAGDIGQDAEGATPRGVFDLAESSRAAAAGVTLATTFAAFAVTEAGRQMGRPATTKTWLVQSANPRSSHAVMHGETVGIDEPFSNGMAWPGDPAGGADEVASCQCGVEITIR